MKFFFLILGVAMLHSSSPATTILPIVDGERARKYYAESLGLDFRGKAADGNLMFGLEGSATLALLEDPAAKPSEHTAISFEVPDITPPLRTWRRVGSSSRTTT